MQLQQTIRINDNKLKLAGDIGFGDSREVNLNVNTREFPLAVITGILRPDIEVDGYLDGSLNMSGFVDDINLDGQINLSAKNIKLGLPASIDSFVGKIVFDKKEIQFSNIQGYYAGEPVNIRGTLSPFAGHDFWDINLTGENLPLDSGSIDGRFDPDITIKGSFKKPKIIGELLTHDLIIKIPFNIQGRFEKGIIEPELNIVLKPGNDIYVKNQYMNILVEEGSLILKKENGRYTLEGKVSSQQGSFDYYNNKFIMENGYADFRKFNNIPDIKASAYTYVKGTKIIININGPADNMLMTFHSQPELPRKEIINLLVSKGGLGELLSGKDTYLPDFIKKEIERFFQETLQLEFIANIEKKIKELFKLDRMEIDTYQLGSNKNISIYLGKRFNQKFYMQYETTLNLDDTINYAISESELSFYYYLNNKLHLESSWLGKDDFRITIETEFKF